MTDNLHEMCLILNFSMSHFPAATDIAFHSKRKSVTLAAFLPSFLPCNKAAAPFFELSKSRRVEAPRHFLAFPLSLSSFPTPEINGTCSWRRKLGKQASSFARIPTLLRHPLLPPKFLHFAIASFFSVVKICRGRSSFPPNCFSARVGFNLPQNSRPFDSFLSAAM